MAKPAQNTAGLTPMQEAAVQHFIDLGDMTAAYRAAGYSTRGKPATINRNAYALFSKPHVAARVQELRDQAAQHCALQRDEGLAILARIARGELTPYLDEHGRRDARKV